MPQIFTGAGVDLYVDGYLTAKYLIPSSSSVANAQVSATAAIDATKLQQQVRKAYYVEAATAVTAVTIPLVIVRGLTGTLVDFKASIPGTIATGADRTVDVDLQKSTGAAAFATVLTSTIHFTNASTVRAVSSGSFSSTALVATDLLQVVITVAGAAGNQAKGLLVDLTYREDAS